jgi:SAM-dependent methyltransferase
MGLRDRLLPPSDWAVRFPPPDASWSAQYVERHRELVGAALDDAALCAAAATGARMPRRYGVGYDERTVEYPWLFGQGLSGRVLDAGSTFNHPHILDRALPLLDDLTIVTLAPEEQAFPLRGVSYVYADPRALPFRDGWFDTAVSLSTLEHVGMDNSAYGVAGPRAPDADAELALAVAELRRVTRPGGRILLSVPFGRREDHRWFRQLDAGDLRRLVSLFEPLRADVTVFGYTRGGWRHAAAGDVADAAYRDFTRDPSPVADLAAAARAVACVAIEA